MARIVVEGWSPEYGAPMDPDEALAPAEGSVDTSVETVVYNTGDGLETIDAIEDGAVPTAVIPPTLKGMRQAGLL